MNPSELIDPIQGENGIAALPGAQDWMQGRTLYGGASSLIAYTHALRSCPDLPPLRAAQIGFVAPMGGDLDLRSTIMRQGRNVTQVRSEIYQDDKLALTAFFLFGSDREANAKYEGERPSALPALPSAEETLGGPSGKHFINNFELRRAQERSGPGKPVVRRWVRLRNKGALDPISELVLMGDILPPGAMRAMARRGPISSINWSFNVLDTAPSTKDGWWLAENSSELAGEGYSSERLHLRDASGKLILSGLQAVAIFG